MIAVTIVTAALIAFLVLSEVVYYRTVCCVDRDHMMNKSGHIQSIVGCVLFKSFQTEMNLVSSVVNSYFGSIIISITLCLQVDVKYAYKVDHDMRT